MSNSETRMASEGAVSAVRVSTGDLMRRIQEWEEQQASNPRDQRMLEVLNVIAWLARESPLTAERAGRLVELLQKYDAASRVDSESTEATNLAKKLIEEADHWLTQDYAFADADRRKSMDNMRVTLERNQLLERALSATEAIEQVETHVRDLAGDASAGSLAQHFGTQAGKEESAANWLRRGAITMSLVAAVVVIVIPIGKSLEGPELFRRLAIIVPLILLSGYLAREAGQHRFMARELRSSEIKLKSLRAYADSLEGTDMRMAFLERVGGSLFTAPIGQPGEDRSAASVDQVDALLQRLIDLARTSGIQGK